MSAGVFAHLGQVLARDFLNSHYLCLFLEPFPIRSILLKPFYWALVFIIIYA